MPHSFSNFNRKKTIMPHCHDSCDVSGVLDKIQCSLNHISSFTILGAHSYELLDGLGYTFPNVVAVHVLCHTSSLDQSTLTLEVGNHCQRKYRAYYLKLLHTTLRTLRAVVTEIPSSNLDLMPSFVVYMLLGFFNRGRLKINTTRSIHYGLLLPSELGLS